TKGDNNDTADPWTVVYADGGWREVTHVPHIGWIMAKAQTRSARVLLVALPILLILIQVLRWIWRSEDDDQLELDYVEDLDHDLAGGRRAS
ncbi:MAG: hypothetical protein KDC46_13880, partial [Thermoleophilia bacterium]|nr:hypothetical protein [Thermoleophilia bacterium]